MGMMEQLAKQVAAKRENDITSGFTPNQYAGMPATSAYQQSAQQMPPMPRPMATPGFNPISGMPPMFQMPNLGQGFGQSPMLGYLNGGQMMQGGGLGGQMARYQDLMPYIRGLI